MKLELFYGPYCPFCQIVLAKIKFLNLAEKIVLRNTSDDKAAALYHIEKTGRRTVPCLYINDEPMFESGDINAWLEANQEKIRES